MASWNETTGKSSKGAQTGGSWLFDNTISASLNGIDRRVRGQEGVWIDLTLQHDFEYISSGGANYYNPQKTDKIDYPTSGVGAAITGGGLSAAAAYGGTIGSVVPGVGTAAGAVVMAGGAIVANELSGYAGDITGAFGFNVSISYREKGSGGPWTEMSSATISIPSAAPLSTAQKNVNIKSTNGPINEGTYEIKVDVDTKSGNDINEFVREITVDSSAAENDTGDDEGFDLNGLQEYVVNNPIISAGAGLTGLVFVRTATDTVLSGD